MELRRRAAPFLIFAAVQAADVAPILARLSVAGSPKNWPGKIAEGIVGLMAARGTDAGFVRPRADGLSLALLGMPAVLTALGRWVGGVAPRPGLEAVVFHVLLVPLVEEIAYRGAIQGRARTAFGARGAVAVSALLFGLAHVAGVGREGVWFFPAQADLFLWGVALAVARERTESLLPGLLSHAAANAMTVG